VIFSLYFIDHFKLNKRRIGKMEENKKLILRRKADEYFKMMYPGLPKDGLNTPVPGYTLDEVTMPDFYTDITPNDVSLKTKIGPVELNFPGITATMDTVCGPELAKVVQEIGGIGVPDRSDKPESQMESVSKVLAHKPCLIDKPHILKPNDTLEKVEDINKQYGISTIPIVEDGKLKGVLFSSPIIYDGHRNESVSEWMKPIEELNVIGPEIGYEEINNIMRNRRKKDSLLPVVDRDGKFYGMYFAQDFRNLDPAFFNGKPVVGVAIGEKEKELEFAQAVLSAGVAMIVIDSSHGDCQAILEQTKRLVKLNKDFGAAIIAGNYAGITGYLDFAEIEGVSAVKLGIGSGSICSTTQGTGIGIPSFTALQESAFVRRDRLSKGLPAPQIIIDGGVNASGKITLCIAGMADAFMGGEYFVAAHESISFLKGNVRTYEDGDYVLYRGMASKEVIKDRKAKRYNVGKTAAEGKEGYVKLRGPLKTWIGDDKELIKSGFSHVGARNIEEIQKFGEWRYAFRHFTPTGLNQIAVRVRDAK
jgi:IMP dehydrogenase